MKMDWTIVMFWAIVALVVICIFWFLKRYLGRILLIILFVAMLCGVFYWLNPSLAEQSWKTFKDLPYTLNRAEKTDLDTATPSLELELPQVQVETVVEEPEERKYSWFASLFGFGKDEESEVKVETETSATENLTFEAEKKDENQPSTSFVIEEEKSEVDAVISSEVSKIAEENVENKLTGDQLAPVAKVEEMPAVAPKNEEKAFEELILDPSEYTVSIDEKGMIVIRLREDREKAALPALKPEAKTEKKQTETVISKPTSNKHLTDQDLREANEIFNL